MAKGIFVKLDTQATHLPQATLIPFATPNNDGSMSKEQAKKLAELTPMGPGVTQVDTGTGLTGGPITSTGTVELADTAVTPGNYIAPDITVDQQGRITAAVSNNISLQFAYNNGNIVSTNPTTPVSIQGTDVIPVLEALAPGGARLAEIIVENQAGFGSPMIRTIIPDGRISLTSDGNGPLFGGTGITAQQGPGSPANSISQLTVNDVPECSAKPGRTVVNRLGGAPAPTLPIVANTIAPVLGVNFVGAGAIDTITPPEPESFLLYILPTAAFTWSNIGNVSIPGTAVVGRLLILWYDSATALFYPSYT